MKCEMFTRPTYSFVLFLFFCLTSTPSGSTPITFAQVAEMKLVWMQSPMTGQHLHAWHVTDGKRLRQNKEPA